MPHDVIISYATVDKPIADAVCAKLEERGIRCWIAPRDILPGADYAASIISAIDSAKIMVLIFSSNANASKHVMREAERAVHDGYPIIPFRIEDVEPSPSLQYYISGQHWLDALSPPLEQHILKLAETVSILLGKQAPPTREPQPQPPEKRCTQCGAANPPNASFCEACGVPFARRPREERVYGPPAGQAAPSFPLLRNRTVILAIVAVVVVVLIGGGLYAAGIFTPSPGPSPSGNTTTLAGDRITYQNPTAGVKFSYPQNWSVATYPTWNGAHPTCYYYIYPTGNSPRYNGVYIDHVDFFKVSKHSFFIDSDANTTLNLIYSDISLWKTESSNVTVIQNATPTTLGGVPAYKITVSANFNKDPNDRHVMTRWYATKGDSIYAVSCETNPATFNSTLNTAEQIVNSFEFI